MRLSDFDYELPPELIAQHPCKERERCRLMVVDREKGTISHRIFSDIDGYFGPGDALVFNDTRVLTCRLIGKRASGGKVEVFLLPEVHPPDAGDGFHCKAMVSPARVKQGEKIFFGERHCVLTARGEVFFPGMNAEEVFALGQIPLPPYIKRTPTQEDSIYYQTVYARLPGSVAAPTAGLHFTEKVIERIREKKAETAFVTLHVGTATFKPVKCEDITQHAMGIEHYIIPEATLGLLKKDPRVCAVGTTACRTLETWAQTGEPEGDSGIFIYPGYRFRVVDRLITNFHLPKTTLFMLVCALAGMELMKKAYAEAVAEKYRFYSYGDAMLIL